jgi:hypothetical protein
MILIFLYYFKISNIYLFIKFIYIKIIHIFKYISILINIEDNSRRSHCLASTINIFIEHVTLKLNNSYVSVLT